MVIADPQIAHVVHYLFEWVALATGLFVYKSIRRGKGEPGLMAPGGYGVIVCGLLGAALGNKWAFWLDDPRLWALHATEPGVWLAGQSVVGGLLGGWIGVEVGKRLCGVVGRTGDDYVVPILAGLVIGRAGCFLAGLHDGTCGLPTQVPWGVDFGEGVLRHPAQLYEGLLALFALVTWPRWRTAFARTPGLAFRIMMLSYLLWRIGVDRLKPVPYAYAFGLSGLQWICILGAGLISSGLMRDYWRTRYE